MKPEKMATPHSVICSFCGSFCYTNSAAFMCEVLSPITYFLHTRVRFRSVGGLL
jgi:hypothetical protein